MKKKLINGNILHLEYPNIKELNLDLFRMSEYYESPSKKINSKVFDILDFLEVNINSLGKIDFFEKWPAYNITGKTLRDFRQFFELNRREKPIYDLLDKINKPLENVYIIANIKNDDEGFEHEIAHAFYYLSETYKKESLSLIKKMDSEVKSNIMKGFKVIGYPNIKSIIDDELNAWLSTTTKKSWKLEFGFNYKYIKNHTLPFRELFLNELQNIKTKSI